MTDGLTIEMETREVEAMIQQLLNKVERPKKLLKNSQRWLHAMTMKMFRGRRPDNTMVRNVKWPKLAPSTIKAKQAKVKRGKAIGLRPMIETGKGRDSIKVLQESPTGYTYGTRIKSKKGYSYMGHHNQRKFPWLFLKKQDYAQLQRMTVDYLNDVMKGFKAYT